MFEVKFAQKSDIEHISELLEFCSSKKLKDLPSYKNLDHYQDRLLNGTGSETVEPKIALLFKNGNIHALLEFFLRYHNLTWHMGMVIMKPSSHFFNYKTSGMCDLIDFCFSYAEKRGYYAYDWAQTTTKSGNSRFIHMKKNIPCLQRYDHYDVGYIPANTLPTCWQYKLMLSNHPRSVDIEIRSGVLRNEHRKKINLSE